MKKNETRHVENIPGMWERGTKENDKGCEFNCEVL
jgi:hypothetical protein